jgi:lipoprotein-releasing system permease protein
MKRLVDLIILLSSKIRLWFYISLKRQKGKKNLIFLSLFFGITGGLAVLIVVLSIMNGLQENHITRRIEIGSYHLVVRKTHFKTFTLDEALTMKQFLYNRFKDIQAVIPFSDKEVIIRSDKSFYDELQVLKLRAIDPDEIKKDSKFLEYFELANQNINFLGDSIILGSEMFNSIYSNINDQIFISPDISLSSYKSQGVPFIINDIFKTNSYDYDRYWGFISIYSLKNLTGNTNLDSIGIKLNNINNSSRVKRMLKKMLDKNYIVESAEEINRGYFTALRLEKTMIIILFSLIFLIVAANTYGALKLKILEKKVDISILKTFGASTKDIEIIYTIESLIAGFLGSFFGVIIGILISYNVQGIFSFVEIICNGFLKIIEFALQGLFKGINLGKVIIYDRSVYYQDGFPVKIYFTELLIICILIIGMAILSSYLPVKRIGKLKPVEVLKNKS